MQIGVDSFGAVISEPATGVTLSPVQRIQNLVEEIVLADQVGLDVFGIGEHHRIHLKRILRRHVGRIRGRVGDRIERGPANHACPKLEMRKGGLCTDAARDERVHRNTIRVARWPSCALKATGKEGPPGQHRAGSFHVRSAGLGGRGA